MNVNHLLLWMSARRQGSWIQFKSAIEELRLTVSELNNDQNEAAEPDTAGFPYHLILRLNLECLAHAEFFARETDKGWRVVPPSLAVHRKPEGLRGVLCGARSYSLMNQLEAPLPAKVEIYPIADCPDQILLTASREDFLADSANKLGLSLQMDAPIALLINLPHIMHPSYKRRIELPFGKNWKIERFSPSTLMWKNSTYEEIHRSKGDLFHFSLGYRHQFLFCEKADVFEVPARIGKYLSAARRHRQVIQYEKSTQTLIIPASFRPPIIIERALILCSGFPASYDPSTGSLLYVQIPQNIAYYASSLLHQELI